MKLLVVVVNVPERAEVFYSALVDLDVDGLEVVNASSVMTVLAREAPIFAGLRKLVTQPKADSMIIFGFTDDDKILTRLSVLLRKVGIDLDKPGTGYAVLVPIAGRSGRPELGIR